MKKIALTLCIALSSCVVPNLANAEQSLPNPTMDNFFWEGVADVPLTASEKESLRIAQQWQQYNKYTVQGRDGIIRFLFGAVQPSVVCAIMQITDIELQAGETINSLHLGDTARWLVEPAVTGSGDAEVQHIVVKPMDVGLETSLMVTTNLRTYHMRLVSQKQQYMPRVAFIYPDAAVARFEAKQEREQKQRAAETIPATGEHLGDLNFDYDISGNGVKPVRVYNDGVRTVIQIPSSEEVPTLLILREGEEVLANYRLQGDRYIVDAVFDKAMLIAGVGSKQKKTLIARRK
ncbi:MAG: P-type conjugative transfer protein TrbG [Pseudomonadota bacterium]